MKIVLVSGNAKQGVLNQLAGMDPRIETIQVLRNTTRIRLPKVGTGDVVVVDLTFIKHAHCVAIKTDLKGTGATTIYTRSARATLKALVDRSESEKSFPVLSSGIHVHSRRD